MSSATATTTSRSRRTPSGATTSISPSIPTTTTRGTTGGSCSTAWRSMHRALESYDTALAVHENFPAAWYNKGNAYANLGPPPRCDHLLPGRPSVSMNDDVPAWHNLGNAYRRARRRMRRRSAASPRPSVFDPQPLRILLRPGKLPRCTRAVPQGPRRLQQGAPALQGLPRALVCEGGPALQHGADARVAHRLPHGHPSRARTISRPGSTTATRSSSWGIRNRP